jgi:hypothetical protein
MPSLIRDLPVFRHIFQLRPDSFRVQHGRIVMIPQNQSLPTVQPGKQLAPALRVPGTEISENPCQVLRVGHNTVPVCDQCLVHLFHAVERTIVIGDDAVIVKVHVGNIPDGHNGSRS